MSFIVKFIMHIDIAGCVNVMSYHYFSVKCPGTNGPYSHSEKDSWAL